MSASEDYCELCDLPRSQCIHGMPAPVAPVEPVKAPPKPRKRAAASSASTKTTTTTATRAVSRRWTPPEVLSPAIVELLREAGGELDGEDVLEQLGEVLADRLRPGDEELTPGGELRWHYAARRARQALIAEGVMVSGAPGMWTLAERP